MCFLVHRGVLAQSSSLESKCKRSDGIETLRLPEVQPQLFVLLLTYLYKWDYQTSLSADSVEGECGNDAAAQFKKHANLYCLASAYRLDHLVEETIKKMEAVGRIEFRSLVEIAREVYPNTQGDDVWFKNYFKDEVTRALTEAPGIVEDQCILDIYKNDGGRLAVDLFTTITSHYANQGAKVDEISTESRNSIEPVPNMDKVIRCENRVQHLKKKDAWQTCQACSRERDQMIAVGNAVVSVAMNDLLPAMYSNHAADQITCAAAETSVKSRRKKVRKALTPLAEKVVKITSTVFSRSVNDCTSQCSNQAEHLKKRGGRWQWEDCTRCLEDRARILHELQLLDSSQSLGALSNSSQQLQEKSIPLHSKKRIVPDIAVDAAAMEIGPAEADFPEGDAQATDALETHPTVSKCSLTPTLQEVIPDSAVNHPPQEIYPADLDSRDVTFLQSDALASDPLDIDCAPELDQKLCSSEAFRTEEAGVVESLHARDSLITLEESPSVPEMKTVKKKDRKGKKAMKRMKAKESLSDRKSDVSVPVALDSEPRPPTPEDSGEIYCDLATAQHATLDGNLAEVPAMPAVTENSSEASSIVDPQLVALGSRSAEQNLADEWDAWASSLAGKKDKKQKKSAFATAFDVSVDPFPAPEVQEPNKEDECHISPPSEFIQQAEQSPDMDIEPGYTRKEKTKKKKKSFSGLEISSPEDLGEASLDRNCFWNDFSRPKQKEKSRESQIQQDDLDSIWDLSKDKKKSREQEIQDDDLGFWGTSKKKSSWDWGGVSKKEKITRDKEADTKKPFFLDFSPTTNTESKLSAKRAESPSPEVEKEAPAMPETPAQTFWDQWSRRAPIADLSDPELELVPEAPEPELEPEAPEPELELEAPEPELVPAPELVPDAVPEAEPTPSIPSCPLRLSHLVDESQWSHCTACRHELKFIARLIAEASPRP